MKILKKIYKKALLLIIVLYTISIFVSQQKMLNLYNKEVSKYEEKIEEAKEEQSSLVAMKDNVNSPEYIEQIAREKLGMYLPNETVFVDMGK